MTETTGFFAGNSSGALAPAARIPSAGTADRTFTIGELSREFGITLRALRFYENKGLIAPLRDGAIRLYGDADRERIALILVGKRLGFTLAEIRQMIAGKQEHHAGLGLSREKCAEQIALLEQQKRGIATALTELRRIQAALSAEAA